MNNFTHNLIVFTFLGIFLGFSSSKTFAQKEQFDNIIPNPGFEEYASYPIGWFYTGRHFSKVQKYWFSSTKTSPDIYGPNIRVPNQWKEKGFGNIKAAEGSSFVGITTYGCGSDKPHCKEYIEVQLKESLVPGQNYHVSFEVAQLQDTRPVNNLGVVFSEDRVLHRNEACILLKPTINYDKLMSYFGKWTKLQSKFVARSSAQYMVLGNFFKDSQTQALSGKLPFGYFYIDNLVLKKVPPILPVPVDKHDLQFAILERNKTITLHNIYFEFDKAELHPRSYKELTQLMRILQKDPEMHIKIIGHTDDMGSMKYNMNLSVQRAHAVKDYLVDHGISKGRIGTIGKGDTEPMATNKSERGRQRNRRIEFKILKMNQNATPKVSRTTSSRSGL